MGETLKTISVFVTESYETYLTRESIQINIEDYPELTNMSKEEIIEYISENAWEMKAVNSDIYDSLAEELIEMEIIRDKIINEDASFNVE
jgi:hypothetical protein